MLTVCKFLSFLGCKAQKGHEDLAKEVIISGRVLNREVYPEGEGGET